MKNLEKQFNKVQKLSVKFSLEHAILDEMINKEYGYHYSEKNMDYIIDCLDYGNAQLDFEVFDRMMKAKDDAYYKILEDNKEYLKS